MTLAARIETGAARILVLDVERISGLARVWQQRTDFVPASQWTRYASLVCFSWQWYGQRRVSFEAAWEPAGFDGMIAKAWALLDECDLLVTYNGKRADVPWLKGPFLEAGLSPPRPWRDVDLYLVGKQFGFESRSLAHLAHRLGLPGKAGRYDPVVAEKALDGDVKAQALMKRYSLQDTRLNVMVYDRVRPWITNHPNLGLYHSDADKHCPMCGSVDMADAGYVRTALTTYQAWRCNGCGGVSRANFVKGRVELRGAT